MKKQSLIATTCLLLALGIIGFSIYKDSQSSGPNHRPKLTEPEKVFFNDFQKYLKSLQEQKNFPEAFNSLQFVKYNFHSAQALKLFGQNPLPITLRPSGLYSLELDFIAMPDSPDELFILQMGLIEIRSGNKKWEMSENFKFPIQARNEPKRK